MVDNFALTVIFKGLAEFFAEGIFLFYSCFYTLLKQIFASKSFISA